MLLVPLLGLELEVALGVGVVVAFVSGLLLAGVEALLFAGGEAGAVVPKRQVDGLTRAQAWAKGNKHSSSHIGL